jgi:hypothetical protein
LINLYREADIISEIRKGRLGRLGNLKKMPEVITVKEVFKNIKKLNVRWKAKEKIIK